MIVASQCATWTLRPGVANIRRQTVLIAQEPATGSEIFALRTRMLLLEPTGSEYLAHLIIKTAAAHLRLCQRYEQPATPDKPVLGQYDAAGF